MPLEMFMGWTRQCSWEDGISSDYLRERVLLALLAKLTGMTPSEVERYRG
jgi:hypothetical protein